MTQKIKIKASDLHKLSEEQLRELARNAIKIKEARKFKSLESYFETAHAKQLEFAKANKRIRAFLGGNRVGKTTCGVVEDLLTSSGTHPFRRCRTPNKGLIVVSDFENACKKVIEPKIMQWAPPGMIIETERNQTGALKMIKTNSGSTIDILSHDQELKVFEGGDWDWVHFDEPPTKPIFNAVWRGLTDRGGLAWITATPITGPWMYQFIKNPSPEMREMMWHCFADMEENAINLGEGSRELGLKRIEQFVAALDPSERAARKSGQFLQLQGLILGEFSRDVHLIQSFPWPAEWPIWETIDPHPNKPYGIAWLGVTENNRKILLRSGLFEGVIDEIGEQIIYERTQLNIQHGRRPKIVKCLIDNYASVPLMSRSYSDPTASRKSVREELEAFIGPRSGGPRVEVAPKNVKSKIDFFRAWLRPKKEEDKWSAEFYAFDIPENERFIYEIENYVWDTKRGGLLMGLKDSPLKKDDDILDAIMQVALTMPQARTDVAQPVRMGIGDAYRV